MPGFCLSPQHSRVKTTLMPFAFQNLNAASGLESGLPSLSFLLRSSNQALALHMRWNQAPASFIACAVSSPWSWNQ